MNKTNGSGAQSDALVLFGVTGDLAYKKIFPALYAMAKRGVFNVPVIGVAASKWSSQQLRQRATESIKKSGKIDDQNALDHLLSMLRGCEIIDYAVCNILKNKVTKLPIRDFFTTSHL